MCNDVVDELGYMVESVINHRGKKTLILGILLCASQLSLAQGLIVNDANVRDDLNWLSQQGVIQLSTSTWPLSSEAVNTALAQAKITNQQQQKVVDAVKQQLNFADKTLKAAVSLQTDENLVPQGFAEDRDAKYQLAVEYNVGGQAWDIKLKANVEKDQIIHNHHRVNLEGSYIAGKIWNQWLIFGQVPTWWGTGHDGSLIRGDVSRPVTGITLQRAEQKAFDSKWLSWIGMWQYQIFAGQLSDYQSVPKARLAGIRLTAQPLPYLELGASRTFQIGGQGRPNSARAYWNAFIGRDNDCTNTCDNENNPSNQLAGFDFRLNLRQLIHQPIGLYGQYVGEDEAGKLPAKNLYLAGIDYSSSFKGKPYQLYLEWADTRSSRKVLGASYTHALYKDGYYQQGYALGHGIGGDSQLYSLGGNIRLDDMNRLAAKLFTAKVNQSNQTVNYAYPQKDKLKGLDVVWTNTYSPNVNIKVNGWWVDADHSNNDFGGSVGVEFSLDQWLFNK